MSSNSLTPNKGVKSDQDRSAVLGDILITIAVSLIFTFVIMMIVQSNYIQAFSWPSLYAIFGLLFIVSKASLALNNRKDISLVYVGVVVVLMVAGSVLVSQHDVDTAKWGVYALILGHITDLAYLLYVKYGQKTNICSTALWGSIISDAAIIFFLLYSLI
jgi:hypothetical protein